MRYINLRLTYLLTYLQTYWYNNVNSTVNLTRCEILEKILRLLLACDEWRFAVVLWCFYETSTSHAHAGTGSLENMSWYSIFSVLVLCVGNSQSISQCFYFRKKPITQEIDGTEKAGSSQRSPFSQLSATFMSFVSVVRVYTILGPSPAMCRCVLCRSLSSETQYHCPPTSTPAAMKNAKPTSGRRQTPLLDSCPRVSDTVRGSPVKMEHVNGSLWYELRRVQTHNSPVYVSEVACSTMHVTMSSPLDAEMQLSWDEEFLYRRRHRTVKCESVQFCNLLGLLPYRRVDW